VISPVRIRARDVDRRRSNGTGLNVELRFCPLTVDMYSGIVASPNGLRNIRPSSPRRLPVTALRCPLFGMMDRRVEADWFAYRPRTSSASAIPWPPPLHKVTTPRVSPSRRIE